jgi:hypothetical protein
MSGWSWHWALKVDAEEQPANVAGYEVRLAVAIEEELGGGARLRSLPSAEDLAHQRPRLVLGGGTAQ